MAKKKIPNYTVIKDTREQRGWVFEKDDRDRCSGMIVDGLKTGDYTLQGFEHDVCVERKMSVEEVANNLGKKKKAFDAEMKRMNEFSFKYIILEFPITDLIDYPLHLLDEEEKELYYLYKKQDIDKFCKLYEQLYDVPYYNEEEPPESVELPRLTKFRIAKERKVTGKYLLRALMEYQTWYGINILFCDNKKNAFKVTQSIFKRLNEMFHGQE